MADALKVKGYREFLRACDRAEKETKKRVRGKFREVGEIVAVDWRQRLTPIDPGSAAGLRPVVRARGVSVEQKLGRTTGLRPDFGSLQMRRGAAAVEAKRDEVEGRFERVIDEIADGF